mmetsp:Transcript_141501/g.452359  ORF Transcript_141501/g.452359 Transcript_141501/m.452359 type:complete len:200 (+) Transcript_141501:195-794(+)
MRQRRCAGERRRSGRPLGLRRRLPRQVGRAEVAGASPLRARGRSHALRRQPRGAPQDGRRAAHSGCRSGRRGADWRLSERDLRGTAIWRSPGCARSARQLCGVDSGSAVSLGRQGRFRLHLLRWRLQGRRWGHGGRDLARVRHASDCSSVGGRKVGAGGRRHSAEVGWLVRHPPGCARLLVEGRCHHGQQGRSSELAAL